MNPEETNGPEYWQETAASEVARLFFGHPYMLEALGSLLPSTIDLSKGKVQKVLDIGCGKGEWARRLAKAHPEIHLIEIDTSLNLIQDAVKLAVARGLNPIPFYQLRTAHPLHTPRETFLLA